jgi:predicted transcriptional regulator
VISCRINFHFAAQALHEALVKEKKMMAAQALRSFIPQFVKVCTIETWLTRDNEGNVQFAEKESAPGS